MQKLVDDHARAYDELRSFFIGVNTNCLDLIKKLKEDLVEAKQKETAAETRAAVISQENKQLQEPLALVSIPSSDSLPLYTAAILLLRVTSRIQAMVSWGKALWGVSSTSIPVEKHNFMTGQQKTSERRLG